MSEEERRKYAEQLMRKSDDELIHEYDIGYALEDWQVDLVVDLMATRFRDSIQEKKFRERSGIYGQHG